MKETRRAGAGRRRLRVAVLGGGIAGASIVAELAAAGVVDVHLVPGTAAGSTAGNQRWLHSGLLYRTQTTARQMWGAHRAVRARWPGALYGPGSASFVVRDAGLRTRLRQRWSGWRLGGGGPRVVEDEAGFRTPDRVIDYPRVTAGLINAAQAGGVTVWSKRSAASIDVDRPRSVVVTLDDATTLDVDHCIVAAGAWSVGLLGPLGIDLPVVLRRCVVVRFGAEVVPALTVWLDARGSSAHSQDLSLTPFRGTTIGADPDGDVVDEPGRLDGLAARAAALAAEYAQLAPGVGKAGLESFHYCVKLEHRGGDSRVAMGVLSANAGAANWPGRLTLAFPGKATLAGRLGRDVLADLRRTPLHEPYFPATFQGTHHG